VKPFVFSDIENLILQFLYMVGCYIIFSNKLNKFYIGATQDEVSLRIEKHNLGIYGKHRFTSTADDWKLFLFISARDYAHAIRIERKVKSMKSSTYIRNLAKYQELQEKLVSST
jgi:putative endonuclease